MKAKHPQHKAHYVPVTFPAALDLKHNQNAINIDVTYDKGGTNVFSGNRERRGYRVGISAVECKEGGSVAFVIGGNGYGRRFFIAEAARFDAKKFDALDAAVLAKQAEIVALALLADYDGLRALLTDIAAPVFTAWERHEKTTTTLADAIAQSNATHGAGLTDADAVPQSDAAPIVN